MVSRAFSAGMILVAVAACESRPPEGPYPVLQYRAPTSESVISAKEVLRLGAVGGDTPEIFGRVDWLGLDRKGNLYVLDGMAQEIKIFDHEGRFLRSIGRDGEGPGEFRAATGAAFHPDGSIWVWDPRLQRLSVFDSSGAFRESTQREWRSVATPWPGQFDEHGTLIDVIGGWPGLDRSNLATQRVTGFVRAVRHDSVGRPTDSLPPLTVQRTAYAGNYIVPFEGGLLTAFDPDGTSWSTHGPSYKLVRVSATGDTLLAVYLAVSSMPVTDAERDSAISSYRLPRGTSPMDAGLVPKYKPAIVRLLRLGGGWVGAFPELGPETGRYMDAFAADGSHQARIDFGLELLTARSALSVTDGLLCGVTTDEFNVPYVLVFDLGLPRVGS